VSCDLDWGYPDPAWPTLEALDTDPPPSGLNVLTRELGIVTDDAAETPGP